ncbi:MAG: hypothetical protein RLZZ251_208 [Actinomycetota bacterium]|jgi:phosphatidylglycerophosphate synthase
MRREDFFRRWSDIHGGAQIKGIVKGWLSISYALARPLLWLHPNLITGSALIFAALYLYWISTPIAIFCLALTLAIDGIDGTVAIMSNKSSRSGAALDAIVDRIVESCWAFGLFLLGAPWQVVLAAWLSAFIQEYMRARAGGLGVHEVGIVTIAERPVRASVIFIGLVALNLGMWRVDDIAFVTAAIWAVMQFISLVTLFISLRSRLQQSPH